MPTEQAPWLPVPHNRVYTEGSPLKRILLIFAK
jgi:hypothetical protein